MPEETEFAPISEEDNEPDEVSPETRANLESIRDRLANAPEVDINDLLGTTPKDLKLKTNAFGELEENPEAK